MFSAVGIAFLQVGEDVKKARYLILLAGVIAIAASLFAPATADMPRSMLSINGIPIEVEIASGFNRITTGLMHREALPKDDGMLFIFPEEKQQCMWMKNTLVPLSVAFVDWRGTITNIEEMLPQTEDLHCAIRPARYAIEANSGWFAERFINAGDSVQGLETATGLAGH